jgi:hypothetical protein
MTTAGDLISRARSFDRDSAGNFVTDNDYLAWCNEAQTDIVAREQLLEQEATTTTDGTNALEFPTDPALVEIQTVLIGSDDWATIVDNVTFDIAVTQALSPDPTLVRVYDEHIEFYPTPETGLTVTIHYKRLPNPVTEAADTIEVPAQLERKVLEYMKAQACFKSGEFDQGNNWFSLYEQGLRKPSDGRERFFTKPVTVSRMPNAWDRQSEARHV